MTYNLDLNIITTIEDTIQDFMTIHPSSYVVIRDEKTNVAVVEIKGTIEFDFIHGHKLLSVMAKEMPDENRPITLPPHQFKTNDDGTITVYHRENIDPLKVFHKKKTSKKRVKKNKSS